jgi:hypothetical protein
MAKKHDRLAFIGLVLAVAALALVLTTWAAAAKPVSDLPSEATYRSQIFECLLKGRAEVARWVQE